MTGSVRPRLPLRAAAAAYRFRESLFVPPALIVVGSMALAEVAAAVDRHAGPVRFTVTMHSTTATWLLSTVAAATITTAGVVFSLTVVSLQLASSQFSPRVMRSFIRDLRRQIDLLVGALREAPGLPAADLERLKAIATGADPADHSTAWRRR